MRNPVALPAMLGLSLAKAADTVCVPTPSAEVVSSATPPDSGTGAPKLAPSTWNWTAPVGVPAPRYLGVMVARRVIGWDEGALAGTTVTAVAVGVARIVRPPGSEAVLPVKLPSALT